MNKKEVIKELRIITKERGKSHNRRSNPLKLYYHCIKQFKYFNEAKKQAGLKLYNNRCPNLPRSAYILDKDLVKLVSFLTFDGHLYKNKFGLNGNYRLKADGFGKSVNYRVYSKELGNFLNKVGTPKGDKMLVSFDIPDWIKKNKEFAKEYLKVAFYCEGCKYK